MNWRIVSRCFGACRVASLSQRRASGRMVIIRNTVSRFRFADRAAASFQTAMSAIIQVSGTSVPPGLPIS